MQYRVVLVTASFAISLSALAATARAADWPEVKLSAKSAVPACATPGRLMALVKARNPALDARFETIAADYKRHGDPTCEAFELVPCDLFVSEATFGLPVYRHGPNSGEVAKLLTSLGDFPERTHQIGVYGLGKCQRLIALLRQAGYDRPVWLHGGSDGNWFGLGHAAETADEEWCFRIIAALARKQGNF